MLPQQISFTMIDALRHHQKAGRFQVPVRRFSALSLRLRTGATYRCNGKTVRFSPAALCLIPEGVGYERQGGDEEIAVIRFHMLNWSPKEILVFPIEDVALFASLFEEALDVWEKKEAGYLFRLAAILNRIFAAVSPSTATERDEKSYVSAAVAYIRRSLADTDLTVAHLAKEVGVSTAQLRRGFHQTLGMSPKQYIGELRAETAKTLIETGFYSQAEIAERCGYADVDYFRTAFKRRNGVTVRAYRKKEES